MVLIDNVSKSFNGVPAVRDLSAVISDSEIFGIVGPNGAGKTTTLKMMTGLLIPDRGRIFIGGYDIVREPVKAKSVFGYVPDKAFLYEKLTAREFLTFTASVYGLGKPLAFERISKLTGLFGITDIEDELIEGFSQGLRQRLLFASALIHNPRVLLIDEPFAGLDPFGVRALRDVITDLSGQGVSIFLATHSLHIAEVLCHRVGFINRGTMVSVKNRDEINSAEGGLEGLFMKLDG